MNICHCGMSRSYEDCCGRFHRGAMLAPTAEALMRARYSAFCAGRVDYLLETCHPDMVEPSDRSAIVDTVKNCRWIKLEVLSTKDGWESGVGGQVEFRATYEREGVAAELHELSRFSRKDGRWYYLSGRRIPARGSAAAKSAATKLGRNEPCSCGSGKKYKKCHG